MEIEFLSKEKVEEHIKICEGQHLQQVAYSTYHKALTQICFGCRRVRTSIPIELTEEKE